MCTTVIDGQNDDVSIFLCCISTHTLEKSRFLLIKAGKQIKMHLALSSLHIIVIYAEYLGFLFT